jgi:TolB-like protein/Flp pilus assembly protein TadD
MEPDYNGAVRFGPFELDTRAGHLRKGKLCLHLQPQPFKVLSLLVSRAGQLISREEIRQELWHQDTFVDFEQGLNVCIRQIRTALNDSAAAPRFVETVPRRGYRFIAPATQVARASTVDSLAVLPFENSNGQPGLDYLCQGIPENLINTLSGLHQLRVIPRQTAFRFKTISDLAKAARELNVRAGVSGRVTSLGNSISVQAELVDLEAHSQLWGGQFSRRLSDILELQEEISREICQHLRLQLGRRESTKLRKRSTQNSEAYQLYLKGRYCSEKRTKEELHKAIDYYHRAVECDPNYAVAYAGLADSFTLLGSGTYGAMPSTSTRRKATEMAVKALDLDSTLAEAHTSLAFVKFRFDWAWLEAESEFKRALELNPRYLRAHHWYALFLAAMGRLDEAIHGIQKAQALDPLALTVSTAEGRIFHFARQFDRAIEQFHNVLELDSNFIPAHFDLGASYEQKAMLQEALEEFETCVRLSGGRLIYRAAVAEAYSRLGRRAEALKILDDLQEASEKQYLSPSDRALVYAALGEWDQSFAWLEQAYEQRDASLVWYKVAPESDKLRTDSRFQQLLSRMDFPR